MKKGSMSILVVILVVSALVLGGVFAYKSGVFNFSMPTQTSQDVTGQGEEAIEDRSENISKVGEGDKLTEIEADLNGTDVDSIDKDVLGVKAEAEGL